MATEKRPERWDDEPEEGLKEIIKANLKLIERLEDENRQLRHDLGERRKELKGIYAIEKIVDKYDSLEDILQGIVNILPPAYQYPEVTCARINYQGRVYKSDNFEETEWKQYTDIRISGKPVGSLEVFYTREMPESDEGPFLHEERTLIDKIAHRIGKIILRLNTSEALRESEDRFRKLVETTSDLIWEIDENAVYTYISPKITEMLGYEPEEVIGKKPFDFMPPEEGPSIEAVFRTIANERKVFRNLENINRHKNGQEIILETSGVPFFDPDGTFKGYRGIDRDITKRKQTEDELKKTNITLQDSLNKVKQLSGLLPICASCKRIRSERGYWESIERYIAAHSEAEFSHSICDECARVLYPDEFQERGGD